ncbi:MAG: hypothetical protein ACUVYA_08205 [Planctomycetota bacterium]
MSLRALRVAIGRWAFSVSCAAVLGPPALGASDLALPSDPCSWRWVESGDADAPEGLRALAERSGVPWSAVWDRALDVPWIAFPRLPCRVGSAWPPEGSAPGGAAHRAVDAFIEENEGLFGVALRSLSAREIEPMAGGVRVSAVQVSAGLPVRGTALRLRIDGDGAIRSLGATLARRLPDVGTLPPEGFDFESWARRAREADGLAQVFSVAPQVVFPGGVASAAAAVAVAGSLEDGSEVEVVYDLSGERLARRRTALSFDGEAGAGADRCDEEIEVSGRLDGRCPDPEDPFRLPADYDPELDLHPLPGACVAIDVRGACPANLRRYSEADGAFRLFLDRLSPGAPYEATAWLSNGRFAIVAGRKECFLRSVEGSGSLEWSHTYNSEDLEFDAFHLLVYHHLRRATEWAARLAEDHGVSRRSRAFPGVSVMLERGLYATSYFPHAGAIFLANDELREKDEAGRWRKIVPTTVYHEYGHEFAVALSGSAADPEVHEGVADAFAAYLSRSSKIGFASDGTFVSGAAARDLRSDAAAYPEDPRRAIAGALWELWEATLDPPAAGAPEGEPPVSTFAQGLLARWLASRWTCLGLECAPKGLRFSPYLGVELYLEADHETLGGDGYLGNGFPHEGALIRAFGRRNLMPHPFRRGDANADAKLDLADAVSVLGHLFLGESETACPDALDADDDGKLDLTDAVRILGHLFLGAAELPEPFGRCGLDPTPEDGLGCWASSCPFIRAAR